MLVRRATLLACLLLAVLLSGCSGLSGTGGKGYITGEGSVTDPSPVM